MLNVDSTDIHANAGDLNIQFFTEYSLADSIFGSDTRGRFANVSPLGDTPDLAILVPGAAGPTLIVIEGKMYMGLTLGALTIQMQNQQDNIISPLSKLWPELTVVHAAILPDVLVGEFGMSGIQYLTWEAIIDEYRNISNAKFFVDVLSEALGRFSELRSRTVFNANADSQMSGQDIANNFGDVRFPFKTMGRFQGESGEKLLEDINSGRWKSQQYQVSKAEMPMNPNWFHIAQFVKLVGDP